MDVRYVGPNSCSINDNTLHYTFNSLKLSGGNSINLFFYNLDFTIYAITVILVFLFVPFT